MRPVLSEYQDLAKTFQKKVITGNILYEYRCRPLKWLDLSKDGPKVVEIESVQYTKKLKLGKGEMVVSEGGKVQDIKTN